MSRAIDNKAIKSWGAHEANETMRRRHQKANLPALIKMKSYATPNEQVSSYMARFRPSEIICYTMRQCGCTYQEIAHLLGTSRQMAEMTVKQIDKILYDPKATKTPPKG